MFNSAFFSKYYFAAVLAAGLVSANTAFAEDISPSKISLQGTGTVSVAPDMAILNLGVVREAKSAREALTANNQAMNAVLSAMKAFGVEDKDLQTSNLNIQPRYHYPKRSLDSEQKPPKIVGYVVNNNLTVRIRELDKVGEILDQAVTLGVNNGGGIQFTNADTDEIVQTARIAAVKDARSKAEAITSELGIGLGKILNIAEGSHMPRPVGIQRAKAMAMDAAPESVPVARGENTYRVNVNITWELDQ